MRRILLLALLLVLPASAAAQRNLVVAGESRVALVIGNGAYKDSPLANPVNDATDTAKALQQFGFKVILKRNAGTREMRQAIREFSAELRRSQVGLFYFAGHGVQLKGENYLIPVGAEIESEAEAEDLAINTNLLLRTMDESQVKVSIVILDACRNNPFARSFRSASRGLAQMSAATGSVIAFATAPGSVAADGKGRNGTYTKHLLASLNQPDTDILKVFQRTRAGVVKETAGKQTPWESTSLIGDFHFAAAPAGRPVPAPAAAPASATLELALWESVKESRNPEELNAYLSQYPKGFFAEVAHARLRALAPPAPEQPQLAAVAPSIAPPEPVGGAMLLALMRAIMHYLTADANPCQSARDRPGYGGVWRDGQRWRSCCWAHCYRSASLPWLSAARMSPRLSKISVFQKYRKSVHRGFLNASSYSIRPHTKRRWVLSSITDFHCS